MPHCVMFLLTLEPYAAPFTINPTHKMSLHSLSMPDTHAAPFTLCTFCSLLRAPDAHGVPLHSLRTSDTDSPPVTLTINATFCPFHC